VLVSVSGNISEAARRLGLHRRSLQRKLAKYPPAR
jgi:two-component system, response regulator RegA